MTKPYHHGNLPVALRAAAAEVITEHGLGGFSLRQGARRAGVSHTAPAHHCGPAHCQVMSRSDLIHHEDPHVQHAGVRAYGVLLDSVAALCAAERLDIDVDEAAKLCWASMQGPRVLHPSMVHLDVPRRPGAGAARVARRPLHRVGDRRPAGPPTRPSEALTVRTR